LLEPRPTSKELDVNKTEMAKKLAKKTGLSQAKASEVLDTIFSTEPGEGIIAVELDAGRDVSVAGFGKFETRGRRARTGRNPATGATIQIAATTVAAFKPAKGLKDRVAI
jgi:nucleoid DNA-binding protein